MNDNDGIINEVGQQPDESRTRPNLQQMTSDLETKLNKYNTPKEIVEILLKTYRKQLDDKWRMTESEFTDILNHLNIKDDNLIKLRNIYKQQLVFKNDNEYDSLLFLSEINDKEFTDHKIKTCFRRKVFNYNKCIKHLNKTERMNIILHKDKDEFFHNNNKKINTIFFDDEEHENKPKEDILYRRINDYYFVANCDYFQKCTDYYFNLYSNIFAMCNLKQITMKYYDDSSTNEKTDASLDVGVAAVSASVQNTKSETVGNEITMKFGKKENRLDLTGFDDCNSDYAEIEYLKRQMPENLRKPMYYIPTSILSLIKNYSVYNLIKFEQEQTIENTDIKNVEMSLNTKFNLSSSLGLFGSQSSSKYINRRVVFTIEFYPEEPEKKEIETVELPLNPAIRPIIPTEQSSNHTEQASNPLEQSLNHLEQVVNPVEKVLNPLEILTDKDLKWVSKSRYDFIPKNSIFTGITKTDGKVYVGRISVSPGKVNLEKGKIWNYWVQNMGSSQSGQILVSDYKEKWVIIKTGETIPKNAIYSGRDENNDRVWVGKSLNNEPGKITCKDNKADEPKMANLWCHSSWSSHQTAHILTVVGYKEDTYLKKLPSE